MILAKERLNVSARPRDLGSEDDICYTDMRKKAGKEKGGTIAHIPDSLYLLENGGLTEGSENAASEDILEHSPKYHYGELCRPSSVDNPDKRRTGCMKDRDKDIQAVSGSAQRVLKWIQRVTSFLLGLVVLP